MSHRGLVALVFVLWSQLGLAQQAGLVPVTAGRKAFVVANVKDPALPTLVLMPGIFRGLMAEDRFIQLLQARGVPFVAIHFSAHPDSIARLGANENVDFSQLTLKSWADETESVVASFRLRRPVLISLSYSGTVTSQFSRSHFPFVLETAPLGRFDESNPELAQLTRWWSSWFSLIPVWGPSVARTTIDNQYRMYWSNVLRETATRLPTLADARRRALATEGYVALVRSVENYDIRQQDFVNGPRRIWIFGEKEEPRRRAFQNQAAAIYAQKTGDRTLPLQVKGAGHIIPTEQPEAYLELVTKILQSLKI